MAESIKELYDKIPSFHCIEGCVECCDNMIQFAPEEIKRLPEIHWVERQCPFLCEKGCSVYENRGFICRIYGSSELLPCPHGCKPEKPLTETETRAMFAEFVRLKTKQEEEEKNSSGSN